METCPNCDAPLKPAARFCLACDKPVDETSRLSVGEPVTVSKGRPVMAYVAIAAAVLVVAGAAFGGLAFIRHQHKHSQALVVSNVKRGTRLLVDAEAGHSGACTKAGRVLAGPPQDVERECAAIVGADPGAKVVSVRVDKLDLQDTTGTAHVHATISDAKGTHTLDRVVALALGGKKWRFNWDGKPEI